ncbi:Glycine--tRNA ligase 1, mitochondrial [Coelomomyces lativittatus]|nr:Glycine--tRNA ligase 1, mitochondrial [Coelomomyces lativittatus]
MAEIEHFVDPLNKTHPEYERHRDVVLNLLPASTQLKGQTTVHSMRMGEAVEKGIINNQTLGYFLARVHLFLLQLGIRLEGLRFRQHMDNEMAHYACDCWDAEILSSSGWIECVGCADRSAYDLTRHSEVTGKSLKVRETLPNPIVQRLWTPHFHRATLGPHFKAQAKAVEHAMLQLSQDELERAHHALASENGQYELPNTSFVITSKHVTVSQVTHTEHVREYVPNVIEPSFGIGRILHCVLEHTYMTRGGGMDPERSLFQFPCALAPIKVLLAPLSSNEKFDPILQRLRRTLKQRGISSKLDDSATSIGKKYARLDELGTPFAITVDFDTLNDGTVTLRERDSTSQIRGSMDAMVDVVENLLTGKSTWESVTSTFPIFVTQSLQDAE